MGRLDGLINIAAVVYEQNTTQVVDGIEDDEPIITLQDKTSIPLPLTCMGKLIAGDGSQRGGEAEVGAAIGRRAVHYGGEGSMEYLMRCSDQDS